MNKIEEAAIKHLVKNGSYSAGISFNAGALSEAAKEHWYAQFLAEQSTTHLAGVKPLRDIDLERTICRQICNIGIGTEIQTIDGTGEILVIYPRAVTVSLNSIKPDQELHGRNAGNGELHRTYHYQSNHLHLPSPHLEGGEEKIDIEAIEWIVINYEPIVSDDKSFVMWNLDDAEALYTTKEVIQDFKEQYKNEEKQQPKADK